VCNRVADFVTLGCIPNTAPDHRLGVLDSSDKPLFEDGSASPGYCFFDLSSWNGTETITLRDFWPYKGADLPVSISGDRQPVPEPGILSLLGGRPVVGGIREPQKARPLIESTEKGKLGAETPQTPLSGGKF
jgi:hypothetical protein